MLRSLVADHESRECGIYKHITESFRVHSFTTQLLFLFPRPAPEEAQRARKC